VDCGVGTSVFIPGSTYLQSVRSQRSSAISLNNLQRSSDDVAVSTTAPTTSAITHSVLSWSTSNTTIHHGFSRDSHQSSILTSELTAPRIGQIVDVLIKTIDLKTNRVSGIFAETKRSDAVDASSLRESPLSRMRTGKETTEVTATKQDSSNDFLLASSAPIDFSHDDIDDDVDGVNPVISEEESGSTKRKIRDHARSSKRLKK
jgi:hypothetical protein